MDPQAFDPATELTSARLFLRPYRPEDGAWYYHMVRENWDHLYEFIPDRVEAMRDEADAEAVIRWLNEEGQQGNLFLFSVWERASGKYIGEVYLANPDWHVPSIELGYFLVQAATGRDMPVRRPAPCCATHLSA